MRHLYNSRVAVTELSGTMQFGTPTLAWNKLAVIVDSHLAVPGEMMCRLDLNFLRLGKDAPMPVVAGRAPDRVGVLFCDVTDKLKAGQRIECLAGPVRGTFEIRTIPDEAVDYMSAHHVEVQVVEVAQQLINIFPGANVEE